MTDEPSERVTSGNSAFVPPMPAFDRGSPREAGDKSTPAAANASVSAPSARNSPVPSSSPANLAASANASPNTSTNTSMDGSTSGSAAGSAAQSTSTSANTSTNDSPHAIQSFQQVSQVPSQVPSQQPSQVPSQQVPSQQVPSQQVPSQQLQQPSQQLQQSSQSESSQHQAHQHHHQPVMMSVKPRSRSSVVPRSQAPARAKIRQASFSLDQPATKPSNTHSPIAMAAAAAVTPEKIRKSLVTQGPSPIRHITSHSANTIPGFGESSSSKQRRLIIAVLDGPKSEFVKVGWGRWAVEGHGTERRADESAASGSRSASFGHSRSASNGHHRSSSHSPGHGGASSYLTARIGHGSNAHRESISRQLPSSKSPSSPTSGAVEDSAVFSDTESSDEADFDDDSEVEGTDEEDWRAIGPAQLRQTSPREQDAIAALVQSRSN